MVKRRGRKPVVIKRRNVVLRYKFKYERRQRVYKVGQFAAITCLVGFGLLFGYRIFNNFFFGADCFKIRIIEIRGEKNISSSEISALIPFREGDNLFKSPVGATEENLRQCKPELKKLNIRRTWQGIVIRFEERVPVAFVKAGGERLGIDAENKPFPLRGAYAKKTIPEIIAADVAGRKEVLDFIKSFEPKAKELYPKIVKFYLEPAGSLAFELAGGLKIYWGEGGEGNIKQKLVKLDQVLFDAEERFKALEYVNLCFFDSGRVIVKPKKTS